MLIPTITSQSSQPPKRASYSWSTPHRNNVLLYLHPLPPIHDALQVSIKQTVYLIRKKILFGNENGSLTSLVPGDISERDFFPPDHSSPMTPRTLDEAHPAAATAAVALAQLHHHPLASASDWDSEMVYFSLSIYNCPSTINAPTPLTVCLLYRILIRIAISERIGCALQLSFLPYEIISNKSLYRRFIPQNQGSFFHRYWLTLRPVVLQRYLLFSGGRGFNVLEKDRLLNPRARENMSEIVPESTVGGQA